MNILTLLDMAASGFGDRTAIGSIGSGITYAELLERAGRAAKSFQDAGSERVSLLDVSSPALPIALFGSAAAGQPFVPLNYRLSEDDLTALAERTSPATLIAGDGNGSRVAGVEGITVVERDALLSDTAAGDGLGMESAPQDPDGIAVLLYTSGTTGVPKAAVLRHKNLTGYILGSVEFMGADEDEATLVSVPPYHIAGLAAILSSVYAGRRVVQLPNFDADAWIDAVADENITHAMVVPTMLARIVERLAERGDQLPSLRAMSYGGGRMPFPVIDQAMNLLPGVAYVNAYGLTETSSTISLLGPDDHWIAHASDEPSMRRRLGSVGRPLPTLEVSIRDEEGNEVPTGTAGEVWVRGEQVAGEYLQQGSKLTADGWFPTNDGGELDEEGYLYVTGRLDDVIIRGGENISPGEIEDVLMAHPDISDAAVIGVPSVQWGETIGAVVVGSVDADELRALVADRLRSSRSPDHIVYRDELPYNDTGKLLRRVLRSEMADLGDG
ncbi:MAG: class I adenylate-forming enzyme family protein [Actinomycetota bacterium]